LTVATSVGILNGALVTTLSITMMANLIALLTKSKLRVCNHREFQEQNSLTQVKHVMTKNWFKKTCQLKVALLLSMKLQSKVVYVKVKVISTSHSALTTINSNVTAVQKMLLNNISAKKLM
jgi:hypothetical protein